MKNPLRRKLRAVSATIAEDMLYVLTGLGLVYVPIAALLFFTVLSGLCGAWLLHLADEPVEHSMALLLFYPAALLPFHGLHSLLPPQG